MGEVHKKEGVMYRCKFIFGHDLYTQFIGFKKVLLYGFPPNITKNIPARGRTII